MLHLLSIAKLRRIPHICFFISIFIVNLCHFVMNAANLMHSLGNLAVPTRARAERNVTETNDCLIWDWNPHYHGRDLAPQTARPYTIKLLNKNFKIILNVIWITFILATRITCLRSACSDARAGCLKTDFFGLLFFGLLSSPSSGAAARTNPENGSCSSQMQTICRWICLIPIV